MSLQSCLAFSYATFFFFNQLWISRDTQDFYAWAWKNSLLLSYFLYSIDAIVSMNLFNSLLKDLFCLLNVLFTLPCSVWVYDLTDFFLFQKLWKMLRIFEGIRQNVRLRPKPYSIDNWIFRLHYRLTTLLFLVATVLVTSRQYIGEHIRCIVDFGIPEHVINTFCFFTSTFTVVRDIY